MWLYSRCHAATGRTQLQTFKVESFQTPTTEKIVPPRSVKVMQNQLVSSVKLFSAFTEKCTCWEEPRSKWMRMILFTVFVRCVRYCMLLLLFRLLDDAWQGSDLISVLSEKWVETMSIFTHCRRILLSGFFEVINKECNADSDPDQPDTLRLAQPVVWVYHYCIDPTGNVTDIDTNTNISN